MIQTITVYCSSSSSIPAPYFADAESLGRHIARLGWQLVYGGNAVGLMGRLASACRQAGGTVIGITPKLFVDKGVADHDCHQLLVCDSMRQRKQMMEERAGAFIALPGGLGTLEELFEIIVARQLGYHDKPIVLLNTQDFFAPLLQMIRHGIDQRFIKHLATDLFHVAPTPDDAIQYLLHHRPAPHSDQWLSHDPSPLK